MLAELIFWHRTCDAVIMDMFLLENRSDADLWTSFITWQCLTSSTCLLLNTISKNSINTIRIFIKTSYIHTVFIIPKCTLSYQGFLDMYHSNTLFLYNILLTICQYLSRKICCVCVSAWTPSVSMTWERTRNQFTGNRFLLCPFLPFIAYLEQLPVSMASLQRADSIVRKKA